LFHISGSEEQFDSGAPIWRITLGNFSRNEIEPYNPKHQFQSSTPNKPKSFNNLMNNQNSLKLNDESLTFTAEEFTTEVETYLKAKLPGTPNVRSVEPLKLNVNNGTLALGSGYLHYLADPGALTEVLETFVRLAIFPEHLQTARVESIVPLIHAKHVMETYEVSEALNDDLVVAYAVCYPGGLLYLRDEHLLELNLPKENLRSLAVSNLRRMVTDIQIAGESPLFSLQTGYTFDASLLLLDELWDKEKLGIAGEIVVSVPTSGMLLVADSYSQPAMDLLCEAAWMISCYDPDRVTHERFVRKGQTFIRYKYDATQRALETVPSRPLPADGFPEQLKHHCNRLCEAGKRIPKDEILCDPEGNKWRVLCLTTEGLNFWGEASKVSNSHAFESELSTVGGYIVADSGVFPHVTVWQVPASHVENWWRNNLIGQDGHIAREKALELIKADLKPAKT
jgi:hypothetical protein